MAPAAADNVDPVYEWLDDGASYLLRLDLPGFKKEDFRVHVDGEGRLTVIGHCKPAPGGDGKALRLHKTFQLPNTANLDTITGRFDSNNVLTLTVPKLPACPAAPAPPTPPLPPPPPQAKAEAPRVAGDKPADQEDKDAAKVGQERTEVERTSLTTRSKEEDEKKAKPTAPPPQPSEKARGDHEQQDHHQDDKARAEHREKVAREAARRVEAARARVAEAKARAERERQCEHWKERTMEEGMKLAEAISKKKEVIATAVAAFTLGVFVSSRLFSRN